MKKIVFIFSILAGFALSAQAQINTSDLLNLGLSDSNEQKKTKERSEHKTTFSQIHVGGAFPVSKFSDGDFNELMNIFELKGFAKTGFNVGYKLYSPLDMENLSLVFGIDAFYNGVNSDLEDFFDENTDSSVDITTPKYLNFPVTVGLNCAFPIQETIKFYGEAAVGGNYSMRTKLSISGAYEGEYESEEIEYTPMFGFAFAFEGGLFIKDKFSIGVRYNHLGSYKFKYKGVYNSEGGTETDKGTFKKTLPITNISVCLGILF